MKNNNARQSLHCFVPFKVVKEIVGVTAEGKRKVLSLETCRTYMDCVLEQVRAYNINKPKPEDNPDSESHFAYLDTEAEQSSRVCKGNGQESRYSLFGFPLLLRASEIQLFHA